MVSPLLAYWALTSRSVSSGSECRSLYCSINLKYSDSSSWSSILRECDFRTGLSVLTGALHAMRRLEHDEQEASGGADVDDGSS